MMMVYRINLEIKCHDRHTVMYGELYNDFGLDSTPVCIVKSGDMLRVLYPIYDSEYKPGGYACIRCGASHNYMWEECPYCGGLVDRVDNPYCGAMNKVENTSKCNTNT